MKQTTDGRRQMTDWFCLTCLIAVLAACGAEKAELPTVTVKPETFQVRIHAEGELKAANSTPVTVPPLPGPQILAWLAPSNVEVQAGDVVARFDETQFKLDSSEAGTELEKIDLETRTKQQELASALVALGDSRDEVVFEKDLVEGFNVDNPLLYSRLEIIDALSDEEYLESQLTFYNEKTGRYENRSEAEMAVITSRREAQAAKRERSESSMQLLNVTAPHAGLFIHENNWFGDPPRVGQSMFPGMKLASLPDLAKMQAEVLVPEKEAIGLKEGIPVNVRVDAFPDRPLQGLVEAVSKTAQSRDRNNPVKYFTVTVSLDEADPSWMLPGRRVTVTMMAADVAEALVLPNQTIETATDGEFVWVARGSSFERVKIGLGVRGMARSQVVTGLEAGDRIALVAPEDSA